MNVFVYFQMSAVTYVFESVHGYCENAESSEFDFFLSSRHHYQQFSVILCLFVPWSVVKSNGEVSTLQQG